MKVGIDIISVKRIKKLLQNKRAKEKVFTSRELLDLDKNVMRLAGRWAAKEAFFKATGKKCDWLEIEVSNRESGEPYFLKSKDLNNISLSISHEIDYAVAVVIML